jgi:hypothetical protein
MPIIAGSSSQWNQLNSKDVHHEIERLTINQAAALRID